MEFLIVVGVGHKNSVMFPRGLQKYIYVIEFKCL